MAKKPGAPLGNVNAVRNGSRSARSGVVLAKLGKRFVGAWGDSIRLRRVVERLVRERHGSLSLLATARINTLCRLEQSCRSAELMIRDTPGMTADEIRQHRIMIVQWSCQRDRLLADLLGDGKSTAAAANDPWAALDAESAAAVAPHVAAGKIDGKAGTLAVQSGDRGRETTLAVPPVPPNEQNGKNNTYRNFQEAGNSTVETSEVLEL